MLTRVNAVEFVRVARNGRTRPVMLVCADAADTEVELFAKLPPSAISARPSLEREAVAACLAGDLGLPVPQPFLVDLPAAWVASVPDVDIRSAMAGSVPVAFGSRIAWSQFAWHAGIPLRPDMVGTALAIFTFDAIIQNVDRRDGNPNCLVMGDHLRIIDHEMAFSHRLIIGWQPPWQIGALRGLVSPGKNTFRDKLRMHSTRLCPYSGRMVRLVGRAG